MIVTINWWGFHKNLNFLILCHVSLNKYLCLICSKGSSWCFDILNQVSRLKCRFYYNRCDEVSSSSNLNKRTTIPCFDLAGDLMIRSFCVRVPVCGKICITILKKLKKSRSVVVSDWLFNHKLVWDVITPSDMATHCKKYLECRLLNDMNTVGDLELGVDSNLIKL